MTKIVKLFVGITLSVLCCFAQAQVYVNCNGTSPVIAGGGYQNGGPCWGNNPAWQQVVVNNGVQTGMQFQVPQGIGYNQPFNQVIGGARYSCTLMERVESGLKTGLTAGFLAYVVERVTKQPNNDASANMFGAGVAYGATIGCTPTTLSGNSGQVVQSLQQGQQFVQGNPCADQGRVPVNVNGQTMCKLPNAPQQVAQVQQVAQANPCADQGRIAVYKPDGNVGCKLPGAPAQPGERPYP